MPTDTASRCQKKEMPMAYRKKLTKRQSKKKFKRGLKTHVKNVQVKPSRGGIRF